MRPAEVTDADVLYAYRLDEEVMYWGNGARGDIDPTREQMVERLRNQKSATDRTFAIEVEEEAGHWRMIGTVSYSGLDAFERVATIGMMIGERAYWGGGYGTEALEQFLYVLFRRLNLRRVELDTHEANKRAIRCYEKAGFVIEGVRRKRRYTINGYQDQILMGLLREEWEERVQLAPKYQ
nr:GNAT family protein [Tumebacillus amylolyticus]